MFSVCSSYRGLLEGVLQHTVTKISSFSHCRWWQQLADDVKTAVTETGRSVRLSVLGRDPGGCEDHESRVWVDSWQIRVFGHEFWPLLAWSGRLWLVRQDLPSLLILLCLRI